MPTPKSILDAALNNGSSERGKLHCNDDQSPIKATKAMLQGATVVNLRVSKFATSTNGRVELHAKYTGFDEKLSMARRLLPAM
jgi:hypothetical protein